MRNDAHNGPLSVRVIAGTRAVFLAIDVAEGARTDLLGFAIGRVAASGECKWLEGRKVFPSVVPNPALRTAFRVTLIPYRASSGRTSTPVREAQ